MRPHPVLFLTLSLALVGCDVNGFASFGDPLDVVVPCGPNTTAWVRSTCGRNAQDTEDGHLMTEIITLGANALDPTAPAAGCLNLSQLHYDTSSRLRLGSFSTRGDTIEMAFGQLYSFTLEKHLPVLQRRGSDRTPIIPFEERSYTFEMAADRSTLTLTDTRDGSTMTYQNLVHVVAGLDLDDPDDAWTFSSISSIPMYHAFTRLLGFGAGGMTQFMDRTVPFLAASQGRLDVGLSGGLTAPFTTLTFVEFEEFGGFILDGENYTLVNIQGNGNSTGDLGFTVPNDLSDPSSVYTGKHDYTDVDVRDGYGEAGCYTLMVDGYPDVQIPSEIYNSIDLSNTLPTDGNAPGSVTPVCSNHVPKDYTVCPRPPAP